MTEPYKYSVAKSARLIQEKRLSPTELMESVLERNRDIEPRLHSWVTLDEQACLAAARRCEVALTEGEAIGPLHGVPIGIKDIYYTRGVKTTACSRIYSDFTPDYDSTAVSRIKASGGIMMGKTVTTEFAFFDPPPTLNPWDHSRTPGGSSSGSAVAVATMAAPAALGSQTAGSVLRPASFNGVVGLKPSIGLISRFGVMPVAWSLDTMGHFTRSVEDAALLLNVLAGYDEQDDISVNRTPPDYVQATRMQPRRPRIGIMRQYFVETSSPEVASHTEEVASRLESAGAEVVEVRVPLDMEAMREAHFVTQNTEGAYSHRGTFPSRADEYGPRVRSALEVGFGTSAMEYFRAQERRNLLRWEMGELCKRYDAILTPSTTTPAPLAETTGDPACQWPWTTVGFPSITIGLPLGIQLAAGFLQEERLLAIAAWCEQALGVKLTPPV